MATQTSGGVVWDTVVFRDDFDGPSGTLDPGKWIVNHPGEPWWTQGRTHFPDPLTTTGPFPQVVRIPHGDQDIGACVLRHHLYNPYDSPDDDETVPRTFLGGEIHTVQGFDARRSYRIEARVRSHAYPSGLVTSFFTYGHDCSDSDEIDFEFLSKQTNQGKTVSTNTWNDGCQKPRCPCLECSCDCPWVNDCACDETCSCIDDECLGPEGLALTEWNTFRIYWYPYVPRIEWKWVLQPNTPDEAEVLLREETDPHYIPDERMAVYFNFWAPKEDWGCAYDQSLQPESVGKYNQVYEFEIDYVEVRAAGRKLHESAKLAAFDAAPGDRFGESVSVSGDTALVGVPRDSHTSRTYAGSAYVYIRSAGAWSFQQKLTAADARAQDAFGTSVAVSGDTAVVGSQYNSVHGSAYVFVRSGGVWIEQQKLTPSDASGIDQFGYSVSVSGNTILVGAFRHNNYTGSAYVFVRSNGMWAEEQKLTASDAAEGDRFGHSVSVSGDTAVIGATQSFVAGFNPGVAYVFVRAGGEWTEQQKLTASDGADDDNFGFSVALSGDTAVVGAITDNHAGASFAGSAYVFVRSGVVWEQQRKLIASDAKSGDSFGVSVSLGGDTAVVGADQDGDGWPLNRLGSAYVFVRSGETWTERQKLTASDAAAGHVLGGSVSVSGDTAVVGAAAHYDDAASGSAYVFDGLCADFDADGVCNAYDQCGNTPPCIAVDAQGRPVGDLDSNCDIGLGDSHVFIDCFGGPGSAPAKSCTVADLNGDDFVDLKDFAVLQSAF